jgi:hypothetical protein
MDRLNDLAPALGGLAILAFAWATLFRIKREQTKSRERQAAE